MNLRKSSILDTLMRGNEVPQPDYIYFLELERVYDNGAYSRKWFMLDRLCQKQHDHIPEVGHGINSEFIKRVKKTRSRKLAKILYDSSARGLTVEEESTQEGDPII